MNSRVVEWLREKGRRLNQQATTAVHQANGNPTALSKRFETEARIAFDWADEIEALPGDKGHTDTQRLDYMEQHLRREGSTMIDSQSGKTWQPKHAWAVASEFDSLRETLDIMMDAMQ